MDVGCGTGILSFFALNAGAKHVYSVDAADIVDFTQEIINKNNFNSRMTVIKGKIEEIELPSNIDKVDIIISEWMGYFLLFESMIDTVLFARDKWLRKDGFIFPDKFNLNMAFGKDIYNTEERLNFWDDIYGIDMSCIKNLVISEPYIDFFLPKNVLSTVCNVKHIDLYTINRSNTEFKSQFKVRRLKPENINCIITWFDVFFTQGLSHEVKFSTGPFNSPTHWKQTMLYLNKEINTYTNKEDTNIISGSLLIKRSDLNHRELDIAISINTNDKNNTLKQYYKLK